MKSSANFPCAIVVFFALDITFSCSAFSCTSFIASRTTRGMQNGMQESKQRKSQHEFRTISRPRHHDASHVTMSSSSSNNNDSDNSSFFEQAFKTKLQMPWDDPTPSSSKSKEQNQQQAQPNNEQQQKQQQNWPWAWPNSDSQSQQPEKQRIMNSKLFGFVIFRPF